MNRDNRARKLIEISIMANSTSHLRSSIPIYVLPKGILNHFKELEALNFWETHKVLDRVIYLYMSTYSNTTSSGNFFDLGLDFPWSLCHSGYSWRQKYLSLVWPEFWQKSHKTAVVSLVCFFWIVEPDPEFLNLEKLVT